MKILASLFLFLGIASASQAQQQPATIQGPTDVIILKFSWSREALPGWENNPFGPSFETDQARQARLNNEAQIQKAKNAGDKVDEVRYEREAKQREAATTPKPDSKKRERPRNGYRYKVVVENKGAKTIKAVDWDYVFFDLNTQQEISRRQFTSEEKIGPGKSKELSVLILSPPTETINSKALGDKGQPLFKERVSLVRITYSDGSVWQHP